MALDSQSRTGYRAVIGGQLRLLLVVVSVRNILLNNNLNLKLESFPSYPPAPPTVEIQAIVAKASLTRIQMGHLISKHPSLACFEISRVENSLSYADLLASASSSFFRVVGSFGQEA